MKMDCFTPRAFVGWADGTRRDCLYERGGVFFHHARVRCVAARSRHASIRFRDERFPMVHRACVRVGVCVCECAWVFVVPNSYDRIAVSKYDQRPQPLR